LEPAVFYALEPMEHLEPLEPAFVRKRFERSKRLNGLNDSELR